MAITRAKGSSPIHELFNCRRNTAFSENHDETALVGNLQRRNGVEVTHWPGRSWEEKDMLIYGYSSIETTIATIGVGLFMIAAATLLISISESSPNKVLASLVALPIGATIFWLSSRMRANRFIVFDRVKKMTHIPKRFSSKHDTIKWGDTSFFIFDENYLTRLNTYSNTNITLIPPPIDGRQGRVPGPYSIGRLIFLQGLQSRHHNSAEAEAIYRYIVAFMTQPPNEGILQEVQRREQAICDEEYNGDRDAMRRHLGWFWYRLDPKKLPDQPNWIRHPDGRWERTGPGVKALRPWWDNLIKPRRPAINQNTQNPDT